MSSQGPTSSFAASQSDLGGPPSYRAAKQLPPELRQHCIIYFETQLYSQALSLLSNFLSSGNSVAPNTPPAALVPPVYVLSLVATLSVHPALTTRTESEERHCAADQALSYLHLVNKLVGPTSADFHKAFSFTNRDSVHSSRKPNRRQIRDELNSDESQDDRKLVEEVSTSLAKENGLWARAEDFWNVVGWAFNCSVKWPERWNRWHHWLSFMLDVLEDDWAEKARSAKDMKDNSGSRAEILKETLIFQYLTGAGTTNRSGRRRIMRAILANGSAKAMTEFREVFNNETKERRKTDNEVTTKSKLNIEEGNFGDYDNEQDDEEMDEEEFAFRASKRSSRKSSRGPNTPGDEEETEEVLEKGTSSTTGIDAYGGMESLLLRRRIMVLLARVAIALPDDFATIEDIYDVYTEFIRPLPLPVFSFFVNPSSGKGSFPLETHASLNKVLLRPLLDTTKRHEDNYVRQDILEEYYLPFAANLTSVVDNAKVSILLCSLLRLLKMYSELERKPSLRSAVETGIKTRRTKAGVAVDAKKRKGIYSGDESEERSWLNSSEQMLEMIVDMVEVGG